MILGVIAAVGAALAYGTASVLQAYGARSVDPNAATDIAPTLRSTIAAMLTVTFLAGMVLDALGFVGSLVSARTLPLFLCQPIISSNLVVTAVLATLVLHARLSRRDWTAIGVVVASLVVLGLTAGSEGHGHDKPWLHWAVLGAAVILLLGGVIVLRLMTRRVAVLAGLLAGVLFGLLAVSVRILDGVSPFDLGALLSDPAAYAIVVSGPGGFYLFTVALQTGAVSAASASIVVGETVVPGALGILLLGDTTRPGWGPITLIAFVAAVTGAVVVAMSSAVETAESAA